MDLLRSILLVIGIKFVIASEQLTLSSILKIKRALEDLSCPVEKFEIQRRTEEVKNGPTALPLVLEERYAITNGEIS